ncbi:TPM domain-containing protein [Anaerobacillus sp. CMMVII]|nr:TPM domain-containing protein [Anaerobacillus sp. CMMVII]
MILSLTALASTEQKIYDFAELLTATEVEELETLADMYSDQTQVDIIILTTNGTDGRPVEQYMGDFYDEKGLGYNRAHGDTVILTIDMLERDVYVAGFYKGETYVDNDRAEMIREEITPYLSDGDFYGAFWEFIELTKYYLEMEPEAPRPSDPIKTPNYNETPQVIYHPPAEENIFFELWFQLLASGIVGALVVGIMAYHSSGRKTTNARTYLDDNNSALIAKNDTFVRKTVTKTKKPTSNNNRGGGGGFGGGGFTGGGHSHSGSKGKF